MRKSTRQTYKVFWQHLRPHKVMLFVVLGSMSAAVLAGVAVPVFYKRFFDALTTLAPGNSEGVRTLTTILLLIFLVKGVEWFFYRIGSFLDVRLTYRAMADLANTCFVHLHGHSFRFFSNTFVGSLVRQANRLVGALEAILGEITWELAPLAIKVIAILVVLFYVSTLAGIALFIWIILYLAVNYGLVMYKLKYDEKTAELDSIVTGRLADTITGNANIKTFTALRYEQKRYQELTESQRGLRQFVGYLEESMSAIQGGLIVILEFVMFFIAIRLWNVGGITLGGFVLIQAYIGQIFGSVWRFGRVIRRVYKNLADAEEMVQNLNTPHEVMDKPGAGTLSVPKGEVTFRNVDFNYQQTRKVFSNFSLSIAPGEKVGLVGISGAGKSTLISLLLRFFEVAAGGIFIDDQNIANVTQDSLRSNIAYVPQDPILFHRTLMENIRYGSRDASDDAVIKASQQAHAEDFIHHLPDGFDTYVGERGIKLSGGERQRVAIARAILKDAPILLLDEATSSLDSHAEQKIQEALASLMEGRTTIVIAHRLSTLMRMDRIVVVHEGKIIEEGTHKELVGKDGGTYKKLWEIQAGGFIG